MSRLCASTLFVAMVMFSSVFAGQDGKKDDPKKDPVKAKGQLPQNWGKLGLSDEQKQTIYKIQNKHDAEIDKLEAKIKELKDARLKETRAVLTADQKKRLEEILLGKDK